MRGCLCVSSSDLRPWFWRVLMLQEPEELTCDDPFEASFGFAHSFPFGGAADQVVAGVGIDAGPVSAMV